MKYRTLGRTDLEVSILGFGGIIVNNKEISEAEEMVAEAVGRGVNIFDVGPTYGNAESRLGPALKPYRDEVVLTCKTEPDQTRDQVREDIENSLELLETDYFDVYQLHEVTDEEALNQALSSGGAMEAIMEAREEGLIHNIGFSAHRQKFALKLMDEFDFDTVMFPINWNYWLRDKEGKKVIEKARASNKGIMAIKALAQRQWQEDEAKNDYSTWYKPIFDNEELAELALKFTLAQDIDTAISPGDFRMLEKGLEIIEKNEDDLKITETEINKLENYVDTHGGQLYPIP